MAAALWYSAPQPKPYLMFVASDVHGSPHTPDADVVKSLLVDDFGISADYVILRRVSNCTLVEVRSARILRRTYNLEHVFAVTHLYHAPRTQRYLNEVLPSASVIPVHPDILAEIKFSAYHAALLARLQEIIIASLPRRLDLLREQVIEELLMLAHIIDPRGKTERAFARILRPTVK